MVLCQHERRYILDKGRSFGGAALWPIFNLKDKSKVTAEIIGKNTHQRDRGMTENTYVVAIENGKVSIYVLVSSSGEEPTITEDINEIK